MQLSPDRRIVNISHQAVLSAVQTELKPLNFYERAGLSDGQKLKRHHQIIISNEEIIEVAKRNRYSLCVSDSLLYVYDGASWKEVSKQEITNFLGECAEQLGVDIYEARYYGFRQDLLKQFFSTAYLPKPIRKGEEVLINLLNGTFVIEPGGQFLKEFDRRDFLTYQLPFAYNKEATAPLFSAYLDKVLPDRRQQEILAEYIAYVFVKSKTLKLEKSLILYGSGANGKSVFFEVTTALLGSANVSNYSLQSLTNESGYQRAMLSGKLLNYASEISTKMDSTLFKQLVSGEPIEARRPYGDPFVLEDYAKLLFNSNELPKDVEHNEAFFRRFIILHFGVTIPDNERDPELSKKIIQQELPGVFNWVLEGLNRLLVQRRFTSSEVADEMLLQYKIESDTVQLFLRDENYEAHHSQEIPLQTFYSDFRDYCIEAGYKACSRKTFSDRLRKAGYITARKNFGTVVFAKKSLE